MHSNLCNIIPIMVEFSKCFRGKLLFIYLNEIERVSYNCAKPSSSEYTQRILIVKINDSVI